MTSSTGGGEGRWPFERVGDGASATPPSASESTPQSPSRGPGASAVPGRGPDAASTQPPADFLSGSDDHAGSVRPTPDGGAGAGAGDVPPGSRRDGGPTRPGRRRPPLWLLILLGALVVGAVVAVVLLLTGRDDPEAPPAETITLPVPTPTIEAIQREPGTPFYDALPSEVLQFALTETGESEDMLLAGALEGYRLVYSDGGATTLTVLAGQWRDAAGPQARLDAVLAQVAGEFGEVPEADDLEEAAPEEAAPEASEPADDSGDGEGAGTTPTAEPLPSPVQGPVEVDGQEVGRYVFVPREDGTGTIWWTNATVFVQLDGPWTALRGVFTAYPL